MREWIIHLACGGCTTIGVIQAGLGSALPGPVYGSLVLAMLFALWWLNVQLWGTP